MKTAIIINGYLRTWKDTKQSFLDTFAKFDADIFVSTYDMQYGYHPHIANLFNTKEDYKFSLDEINDLFSDMDLTGIIVDDAEVVDKMLVEELKAVHPNMKEFKNCYGQSRKLKVVSDEVRRFEESNDFRYDYIIKTRADLIYEPNADFSLDDKSILIDSGNVFPNDWLFMVNREDYYYVMDYLIFEFFNYTNPSSSEQPPHRLHENAFKSRNLNIEKRKLVKSVLRSTGEQVY